MDVGNSLKRDRATVSCLRKQLLTCTDYWTFAMVTLHCVRFCPSSKDLDWNLPH